MSGFYTTRLNPEKRDPVVVVEEFESGSSGEADRYVLDASLGNATRRDLKTTKDGSIILSPQPSDDPNDPLNWSQTKKNFILGVICFAAFLPDYGFAINEIAIAPQLVEWQSNQGAVFASLLGSILTLGVGGILAVSFSAYFGRYPVLFWFMVLALITGVWSTAASTLASFVTARIFNSLFGAVAQASGLMFIQDIFFHHEHARKINIWAGVILISPYNGPMLGAIMEATKMWNWGFAIYTIQIALCVSTIIFLVDETYYDRRLPINLQPLRGSKLMRLIGVSQWRSRSLRNNFRHAMARPWLLMSKATAALASFYYTITFAWALFMNAVIPMILVHLYGFEPKQVGYSFHAPIAATILAQAAGHWLYDFIARRYMKRRNGRLEPEARLAVIWLSTPFLLAGLILLGLSMLYHYHYVIVILAWCLYAFGILITTVGINLYAVESYPEAPGEVAAWMNFGRTSGSFLVNLIQIEIISPRNRTGFFVIQVATVVAGFIIILVLQKWGKRLRVWNGHLRFKTN